MWHLINIASVTGDIGMIFCGGGDSVQVEVVLELWQKQITITNRDKTNSIINYHKLKHLLSFLILDVHLYILFHLDQTFKSDQLWHVIIVILTCPGTIWNTLKTSLKVSGITIETSLTHRFDFFQIHPIPN